MIEQFNFTADTCDGGDLRFIGKMSRTTEIFPIVCTEYFQNRRKMSIYRRYATAVYAIYRETPVFSVPASIRIRNIETTMALGNLHIVDTLTLIATVLR